MDERAGIEVARYSTKKSAAHVQAADFFNGAPGAPGTGSDMPRFRS